MFRAVLKCCGLLLCFRVVLWCCVLVLFPCCALVFCVSCSVLFFFVGVVF